MPISIRFFRAVAGIASIALITVANGYSQAPAGSKTYTLAKVSVSGSSRYKADDIFGTGGLRKGQKIDLAGLDAAASQILKTGAITKIGYSYALNGDSISVDFQVTDAGQFLPCLYDNFVWFSDSELTAAVHKDVPLFDGSAPIGGEMVAQVTAALESFLHAHKISGTVTSTMNGRLGGDASGYTLQVTGVP